MSKNMLRAVAMVTLFAFTGCAASTVIESKPTGAKLYLDGEYVGKTPYTMTDTKIVFSTTTVKLEMPGYETLNTTIQRSEELDVAVALGGFFCLYPLWLWAMKYRPVHTFELEREGSASTESFSDSAELAFAVARGMQAL